jgi:hypothetical protein
LQQLNAAAVSAVIQGKEARAMRTGHCRHDWTLRSETLSEAFPAHAGLRREFRVCTRCLRLEELEAQAVAVEFPAADGAEAGAAASDDKAA